MNQVVGDMYGEPEFIVRAFELVLSETDHAWLLGMPDGREIWFPKSRCRVKRRFRSVVMPIWLAVDKGLE